MFVLSEQQVSFILDDIRRNGIEREELQLDLLDHICCIIENEMNPDQDFGEFYQEIIPRFFKRELGEIQEETDLLLTFKNYYTMKKVMLYSGTFAAIGVVAGSFFKIMHWPGASVLFLLSVFILSFIFLPILFLIRSKEIKIKREKIILGLATAFGILISISTLFKVMHWPGANIMWLCSLGILFFLFLPVYFFGGIRNPETKTNTIASSVLILFAGGLLFLLTNLRSSHQINYMYATTTLEIRRSYEFATAQNKQKYAQLKQDTAINELRLLCDSVCARIEKAKQSIVNNASSGQEPKPDYERLLSGYAGNYDLPTNILFNNKGEAKALLTGIKNDIAKLKTLAMEKFNRKDLSILNTDDVDNPGNAGESKISWERSKFFHVPFELVMINFTELQLKIRILESGCI